MTEENKELVRRFLSGVDKGDQAVLREFVSKDYDDHNPPPYPGLPPGIAGAERAFELALAAFSDFSHEVLDQIAEGDRVVSRIRGKGIHTGDFLGVPPTGRQVEMTGIAIHRIAGGMIVEHWAQIDALGLFQQLGVFPAPDSSAETPTDRAT